LSSAKNLRICIGTTDVHEHGKYLLEQALEKLGLTPIDVGVSVDPEVFIDNAIATQADGIAISTYNGVALSYTKAVKSEMERRGLALPILIGGRLNEIPKDSNSGLPMDVSREIAALGVRPCADLDDMLAALRAYFPL